MICMCEHLCICDSEWTHKRGVCESLCDSRQWSLQPQAQCLCVGMQQMHSDTHTHRVERERWCHLVSQPICGWLYLVSISHILCKVSPCFEPILLLWETKFAARNLEIKCCLALTTASRNKKARAWHVFFVRWHVEMLLLGLFWGFSLFSGRHFHVFPRVSGDWQ